jgi:hypothetical protein
MTGVALGTPMNMFAIAEPFNHILEGSRRVKRSHITKQYLVEFKNNKHRLYLEKSTIRIEYEALQTMHCIEASRMGRTQKHIR